MTIFVSRDLRDYIHRLVLEADRLLGGDYSKRCQTARVLDAGVELENLARMRATSLGQTFVTPEDVKAMAVYVIARRHADMFLYDILAEVPVIEPKTVFTPASDSDPARTDRQVFVKSYFTPRGEQPAATAKDRDWTAN